MSMTGLIIALLLPALLGIAWLQLFWRSSHWAARIGYGYLLGIFIITSILRLWGSIGLTLSFPLLSTLFIGLSIIPLFLTLLASRPKNDISYTPFDASWQKFVCFFLIAILIVRYGGILQEIVLRPLYPWDAWANWAPKAKIWFELKELTPIVSTRDWATESIQNNAYTLGIPPASKYPPIIPLIQTWIALGIGNWIDNLINLPWAFCIVALGFSFYGQGRMLGAKPHEAMFILFLLLSTPYINVHTALAGYAELWLASFYTLAGMAFINWSQTRDNKQAIICIIFAIACTQAKIPGIVWAATFIPASLFVLLPKRWGYFILVLMIVALILFFYLGGFYLDIGDMGRITLMPHAIGLPGIGYFRINHHPVSNAFMSNDLIRDNWHLMGWLVLLVAIPLSLMALRSYKLLAANLLILMGILFLYIVFFYTGHYKSAMDSTTINRAVFHFMPLLCFYILFLMTSHMQNNSTHGNSEFA